MVKPQPFKFPQSVMQRVREMMISNPVTTGLRNTLSSLRRNFYEAPTSPALRDTRINRDAARALYYNTDPSLRYASFISGNIIDGTADYIGLPILTVGDEAIDEELNGWISEHWASELWQLYRTVLRDSDAWVRIRLPLPSPLIAPTEEQIPIIQVYDSDRVTPYYNPSTQELERVEIVTHVYIEDEPFDPASIYATGVLAHGREHEIVEIITPDEFRYWDATDNYLLDSYTTPNDWHFVPMLQVFNDYDEALHGGSSDLERIYPLLKPFDEIFHQTRTAFKYHANPKVQVQVNDVMNFIKNNFPEALANGQFTGKVSWQDKDVFFMQTGDSGETNESMSFVTANLNIADVQTLLELIIDCICIGAGVTESVLFRARAEGSESSDEFQRFKKKIGRKRDNLMPSLQHLVRMAMYITKNNPLTPQMSWPAIDTQDLIDMSTAFNNEVTALEVLSRSQIISSMTYRAAVRKYVPAMKDDASESADAQKDITLQNQQQIDLETKLAAINPPAATPTSLNGGGPNSGRRTRVKAALPMQVTPSVPGE